VEAPDGRYVLRAHWWPHRATAWAHASPIWHPAGIDPRNQGGQVRN
jgi:hypothetical protein